ncbi:hypothetical protein [Brevibacterium sp. RIT 803]|uniref:hypothetical protein n=1 Tax=Brevibacterium sp. RIT 803 TaxID=2810210 RepID=UPI001952387E|nr:hypothetical protein [Brevibacterium sp. RIT 803]MBM6591073.1 hypothetical protein [Brevibacterium sp. RIT 803]
MKRVLPAIALIAGLALTGCSGTGSQDSQAEEAAGAAQPAAEESPEVQQLDENQLKKIIESTDVDGQSFKSVDIGAASGSEALKALESAEYEPAECKDLAMSALNATQASNGTTLAGTSADNTMSVALMSLADEDAAGSQLKNSTKVAEKCSDVTIKSQGIEMTMSYESFDATVEGADESVGVRAKIGAGGQTVLDTDTVTSRVGNNIVTAANIADTGDEEAVPKTAKTFVDAVKNAN